MRLGKLNYKHHQHHHKAIINHLTPISRASTQTAPILSLLPCVAAMLIKLPCPVWLSCPCAAAPSLLPLFLTLPCLTLKGAKWLPSLPYSFLPMVKEGVKEGCFSSKRLFCKLLIVRGKVRVCHRAETTILLPVCNRLFWLLNGCTDRLVMLQPAACWLNAFLPYLVGGHFGLIRCLTCCLLAA